VFSGFSASVFEWFAGLERDNSREYFTVTRERYETEVRGALTLMLQELSGTFGGAVRVFRQQNDMRLAPAYPYKRRTYGVLDFSEPVKPRLYADISALGLFAGTGYVRLAPDQLIRTAPPSQQTNSERAWLTRWRQPRMRDFYSSVKVSARCPADTRAITPERIC
jgi:uncharacterized protein (DUF2461 family)